MNCRVLDDYSITLKLTDISYGAVLSNDKFYKMQLLERKNKKQWFLWFQQGRIGQTNPPSNEKEFLNKHDAMGQFEKRFNEKTGNKWIDREYFQ